MPVSTSRGSRGRAVEAVGWVAGICAAGGACGDGDVCGAAAPGAVADGDEDGMSIGGALLLAAVRVDVGARPPVDEPPELPEPPEEPEEFEPSWCSCVGAADVAGAAGRTVIPAVMFGWTVQ
ncbi:hypothetical protein SALBM311S_01038 [Streptomyces alboniger]